MKDEFADDGLSIPAITDPRGMYWHQPSANEIAIDETYAVMNKTTFDSLPAYSSSLPSAVYSGKMWRRWTGSVWLLMWFGPSSSSHAVWIFNREIIVI
jgi:hypothetical protein